MLMPQVIDNPMSAGPRGSAQTGPDGAFTFQSPVPGEYFLQVSAPEFARHNEPISIPVGESIPAHRVVLSSLFGRITGRVVARDGGFPLQGIVSASPEGREALNPMLTMGAGGEMASPNGEFTLDGLVPGVYTVQAVSMASTMAAAGMAGSGPAFQPGRLDGVEVRAGEAAEVVIELVRGVMVTIQVLDPSGRPVQGVRQGLVLEGPQGPVNLELALVDNPVGAILTPGAYAATFRVEGYREHVERFEILAEDQSRNLRVTLQP